MTTHNKNFVVFITVQNLVRIASVFGNTNVYAFGLKTPIHAPFWLFLE